MLKFKILSLFILLFLSSCIVTTRPVQSPRVFVDTRPNVWYYHTPNYWEYNHYHYGNGHHNHNHNPRPRHNGPRR